MGQWITRWVNGSLDGSWVTDVDPWSTLNTMCCGGMVVSAVDRVCCNEVVHDVIPGYVCCDTSYEADNTTLCCTARNGVERVIIVCLFVCLYGTYSYTFIFVRQSLTQAQKTSQLLMRNVVTSHQFPPSFPVVTTELTIHSWSMC